MGFSMTGNNGMLGAQGSSLSGFRTSYVSIHPGVRLFADLELISLLQVMPPGGVTGWPLIFPLKDVIWSAFISTLPNSRLSPQLRRPMPMTGRCRPCSPPCLQAYDREAGLLQKNRSLA